ADRGEGEPDHDQRAHTLRVARHVEARAPPEQRRQQDQRCRGFLDVEALCEVRDRRAEHDDRAELPGAPASARERAREPDQRDPEGQGDDPCRMRHARRQHAPHEVVPVRELRRQRRDDSDKPDDRSGGCEHRLRPKRLTVHAPGRVTRPPGGCLPWNGYNGAVQEAPATTRVPLPRWVTPLLALTAAGLVPWTLYLTFTLPSRQVTEHYDV